MRRLTKVFETATRISFDNRSPIVLMSDVHRGDGSWADTFAKNRNIYCHALKYYDREGYTYIELGDGDELWENRSVGDIVQAHADVFDMLKKLHRQGRFFCIFGNHDMEKNSRKCKQNDTHLDRIRVHEGLVLVHEVTGEKIFLVHGHQVDFFNSAMWKVARFLVRNLWRPLEIFGVHDPTSAAKNHKRKRKTEQKMLAWVRRYNQMLVAGHTHRPVLPRENETPYLNDGSCVHPRSITAIEIFQGEVILVKWLIKANPNGQLYVARELLAEPVWLDAYR